MRVLVTGGAGYIGSVVVEELVKDGHNVFVYDNLSKGHAAAVDERAELVVADLHDADTLTRLLKEWRVEAVIHMAASSLVGESVENPSKYYRNNIVAGLSLLDAMIAADVRRLVFSSTAAVYGEPDRDLIEESAPLNPTNTYGETKLAFERALQHYARAYGLGYASLRYFNAAGATARRGEHHDPESHLIPLVLQVAQGKREAIDIYGDDYPTRDGTCVRDYIHVADLARAHILALKAPPGQGAIYNLGCGGDGYTVLEVIEKARAITGCHINYRRVGRRAGDPPRLVASSGKITRELGWRPQYQDLREIIASAWAWMQKHQNGYEERAIAG